MERRERKPWGSRAQGRPAGPHWVLAPVLPPCAAPFAICVAAFGTRQVRSQAATSAVSGATTARSDAGWGCSPAEPRPALEPPPWSCSGSSASLRARRRTAQAQPQLSQSQGRVWLSLRRVQRKVSPLKALGARVLACWECHDSGQEEQERRQQRTAFQRVLLLALLGVALYKRAVGLCHRVGLCLCEHQPLRGARRRLKEAAGRMQCSRRQGSGEQTRR